MEDPREQIKLLESTKFVLPLNRNTIYNVNGNQVLKFGLYLINGPKWRVKDFWGDYGLMDCRMEYSLDYSKSLKMYFIVLANNDKIIKVLTHSEPGSDCDEACFSTIDGSLCGEETNNRYVTLLGFNGGDCILDCKTAALYRYGDYDSGASRGNRPSRVINFGGKLLFVSRTDGLGVPRCLILVNSPEDIVVEHHSKRFLFSNDSSLLLDKETGLLQAIYDEGYYQTATLSQEIAENTKECWKSDLENFIYFDFKDGKENVFFINGEESDFIFGNNSDDVSVYQNHRLVIGRYKKLGKRVRIEYSVDTKKYELKDDSTFSSFGECDKYGVTEKEKLGDYNMKKYWKGYSPEQQAQMDTMWTDRKNSLESDGSEAMKAWDDYDTKRYPEDSYNLGRNHAEILGKGEGYGKDHWQGRVGLKDPADWFSPGRSRTVHDTDFYRDFYKVGTNGKPLEQPWRDEDEVHANFAEYPEEPEEVYEAVNKIKSLLDRMGLNN